MGDINWLLVVAVAAGWLTLTATVQWLAYRRRLRRRTEALAKYPARPLRPKMPPSSHHE